ncbi:MAG: epoxyqueuosine reductase QueH [Candidatus Omnitrophica bacterium]|nr:epoxyqueuosine reductase QueH [Candidatus Omnitrophota bacterium]
MNVLLHICCAPCAIYPVESLKKAGHKLAGFFYNPNIHPYSEYLKRRAEVEKYSKESSLNVIYGEYDLEKYFQIVAYDGKIKDRCQECWWLRLVNTAKFAKENGFEAFTTTLLASPYQDQDIIKTIGEDVAAKCELKFYFEDFRLGFKVAHDKARAAGIYCQNYCGCLFSEKERIEEKEQKKKGKIGK